MEDIEDILLLRINEIEKLKARIKELGVYVETVKKYIRSGEVVIDCDECDGDGNRTEMEGNDPDSAKIVKCPYCDYGSVTYKTVKQ